MLNAQVVVLQIDVEIRQDQAILNEGPHDASHLIAIKLDYRIEYFNFSSHEGAPACSSGFPELVSDLYTILQERAG
jgi:hypothetical protein